MDRLRNYLYRCRNISAKKVKYLHTYGKEAKEFLHRHSFRLGQPQRDVDVSVAMTTSC